LPAHKTHRALILVLLCTVTGAAAQMLMKIGASGITNPGFLATVQAIFTHPTLFLGYCLYGLNALLLVLALREGELSLLYPVIALTYVWVTLLSIFYLHEAVNGFKMIGLTSIVLGVAVIGRSKRS
jgi:multidrug transporter EmrE-like cation transporter